MPELTGRWMMGSRALVSDRSNAHWWHLLLLLGVISVFESGRMEVASDAPFMLSVFTRALYTCGSRQSPASQSRSGTQTRS